MSQGRKIADRQTIGMASALSNSRIAEFLNLATRIDDICSGRTTAIYAMIIEIVRNLASMEKSVNRTKPNSSLTKRAEFKHKGASPAWPDIPGPPVLGGPA